SVAPHRSKACFAPMFLCLRTKTRPVRFFGLLALGSRQRPQAAFLDSRRCDLRFLPRSICFGGILCFQLYFFARISRQIADADGVSRTKPGAPLELILLGSVRTGCCPCGYITHICFCYYFAVKY